MCVGLCVCVYTTTPSPVLKGLSHYSMILERRCHYFHFTDRESKVRRKQGDRLKVPSTVNEQHPIWQMHRPPRFLLSTLVVQDNIIFSSNQPLVVVVFLNFVIIQIYFKVFK